MPPVCAHFIIGMLHIPGLHGPLLLRTCGVEAYADDHGHRRVPKKPQYSADRPELGAYRETVTLMAKPSRERSPSTPVRSFLRDTALQLFAAVRRGTKSLGTPKGLLAAVPLAVSLIAYVKASFVTTNLFVLFIQPISMETTIEQATKTITRARVNDFEMFLISEGHEAVYVTDMRLNIAPYAEKGHFNESCGYEVPNADPSTQVFEPYLVVATPLSKDYAYQLHSGFVVSANTVLPMSTHLKPNDDSSLDDKIATSTGATKSGYDARAMQILYPDASTVPHLDISLCLSGTAFTSSGKKQRFLWTSDTKSGRLHAAPLVHKSAFLAALPGGSDVPAEEARRLSLSDERFERPISLFRTRSFSFF